MKPILVLLPLTLALLWLPVSALRGKKPGRGALIIGVSLLTLLYFVASAATGIFWVASQELPVFDWHYLFGYILLCLVSCHVYLHWRNVAGFFRRHNAPGPPAFRAGDGGPPGAAAIWPGRLRRALCLTVLLALAFFFGNWHAARSITVLDANGASPGDPAGGINGAVIAPKLISMDGKISTLAQMYHEGSSYPANAKLPGVSILQRPDVYLDFKGAATPLPAIGSLGGGDILEMADAWRTGMPVRAAVPLGLEQIALLLYHTQGISLTEHYGGIAYAYRTAPSAGALYPLNVYLVVREVAGLAPGLYYYHPARAALILVRADPDLLGKIAKVSGSPSYLQQGTPALVLFTTTFARSAYKYKERAYRYLGVDTGHAAYNLALCAAALGWRAPLLARFDDQAITALTGRDVGEEAPMLLMPLAREQGEQAEPRFASAGGPWQTSLLALIHGGGSLKLVAGSPAFALARHPSAPDSPRAGDFLLPAPAGGKPLLEAIRLRRSVRKYSPAPLSLAHLSALLAAAAGERQGVTSDPLLFATAPVTLYAVVAQVTGLAPGVYRYLPGAHALRRQRQGDFSAAMRSACIGQEVCGSADVVFAMSVKWHDLYWPDGDRGYRYATLRAGLQGEGLYLASTALGLSVTGVGAFGDGAVAQILGIDHGREVALHLTAVGS